MIESQAVKPFSAVDYGEIPRAREVWRMIVESSPDGWFQHTRANMEFNLCAGQKYAAREISFFVLDGKEVVGIAPLALQDASIGRFNGREAGSYSGPLPWPCFLGGRSDLRELEAFAFEEMERRAREAGAGRIRLRFAPVGAACRETDRMERIILARRYLQTAYDSHLVILGPETLPSVRERYRRYNRKYSPQFSLEVLDRGAVTAEWEQAYFELHVKDAGGQFRSRESYSRQADLAREGEGFFVAATHKENGRRAGMLLVSLYKDAAYDNSVGVDPDFQDLYVSHLLKWRAIEELISRGARSYEMGGVAGLPGAFGVPSEKQRGISHFKEGWARNGLLRGHIIEKYFDRALLKAQYEVWETGSAAFFGLP